MLKIKVKKFAYRQFIHEISNVGSGERVGEEENVVQRVFGHRSFPRVDRQQFIQQSQRVRVLKIQSYPYFFYIENQIQEDKKTYFPGKLEKCLNFEYLNQISNPLQQHSRVALLKFDPVVVGHLLDFGPDLKIQSLWYFLQNCPFKRFFFQLSLFILVQYIFKYFFTKS